MSARGRAEWVAHLTPGPQATRFFFTLWTRALPKFRRSDVKGSAKKSARVRYCKITCNNVQNEDVGRLVASCSCVVGGPLLVRLYKGERYTSILRIVTMHIRVVSPASADLSHPSVTRALPSSAVTSASVASLFCLLAFESSNHDAAVGSLRLQPAGRFAMQAHSLRLAPADEADRRRTAVELLGYAVRNEPCLRTGGALLANAATDDSGLLPAIGFCLTGVDASQYEGGATNAPDDGGGGGGGAVTDGYNGTTGAPLLAWRPRRESAHDASAAIALGGGGGLVAVCCSNLETCLDFWSLLDFRGEVAFSTSGARAVCISAPWTSLALELLELPPPMQGSCSGLPPPPPPAGAQLGLSHVCVDVTPISVDLEATLRLLQERSQAAFGRTIRVLLPPHQQMLDRLVVEAAVLRAPDGVQLRLMRRMTELPQALEQDWESVAG